jgi:hypothetical protein
MWISVPSASTICKCIKETPYLYTALYFGDLKSKIFCLCKTDIIRVRISEVLKEEIRNLMVAVLHNRKCSFFRSP